MTHKNLALFPFDNLANIATSSDGWFLEAGVLVDALAGDDTITGISTRELGISNDGKINTGKGDDLVNALEGGFGGIGNTYLGDNNDTLMGFGTGSFYGGSGSDKVLFGEGTYTIRGLIITSDGVTMSVNEFENIGGAYGGLFAFKDGTLTVDSKGVGTFA